MIRFSKAFNPEKHPCCSQQELGHAELFWKTSPHLWLQGALNFIQPRPETNIRDFWSQLSFHCFNRFWSGAGDRRAVGGAKQCIFLNGWLCNRNPLLRGGWRCQATRQPESGGLRRQQHTGWDRLEERQHPESPLSIFCDVKMGWKRNKVKQTPEVRGKM